MLLRSALSHLKVYLPSDMSRPCLYRASIPSTPPSTASKADSDRLSHSHSSHHARIRAVDPAEWAEPVESVDRAHTRCAWVVVVVAADDAAGTAAAAVVAAGSNIADVADIAAPNAAPAPIVDTAVASHPHFLNSTIAHSLPFREQRAKGRHPILQPY